MLSTQLLITCGALGCNPFLRSGRRSGAALGLCTNLASNGFPHGTMVCRFTGKRMRNLVENHITNLILRQQHGVVAREGDFQRQPRGTNLDVVGGTKPTLGPVEFEVKTADAMRGHESLCATLNLCKFHDAIIPRPVWL